MADMAKYASAINGGALFSDFKAHISILRTKRTVSIAYAFVFIFIAFTIFLAFSPSSNSSSPWFANIFTVTASRGGDVDGSSHGSRFSSVYYYFFPNSSAASGSQPPSQTTVSEPPGVESSNITNSPPELPLNQTANPPDFPPKPPLNQDKTANPPRPSPEKENRTQDTSQGEKSPNQTVSKAGNPPKPSPEMKTPTQNATQGETSVDKVAVLKGNSSAVAGKGEKGVMVNNSSTSSSSSPQKKKQKLSSDSDTNTNIDLIKSLVGCDFFDGSWVKDESYPLYKPNSCSLIDEQFNCFRNGRPDNGYYKLKWKPKACTLPRLDGSHMLELLRGKRLVFVGDSLNRNMWESLICILRNSVKDQSKVYEENGRHHFRGEASYSFAFKDYKFTVEFFVTPFLVQEWEVAETNGSKKETLRLDVVSHAASKYKNADIIVFNTGHWWTHDKTALGKDYYQEGSHVYSDLNVLEAFRKAMTTWGRWVDANVNPKKSLVFFRGYSASHFSGGQWNSGGQCDHETEPIKNETYLSEYPPKMGVLEKVLRNMKTPVTYMNVTRMTDYRKDGHPSIYRKVHLSDEERRSPLSFQDCSHWCLPGVPDAWNEILYAEVLVKLSHKRT